MWVGGGGGRVSWGWRKKKNDDGTDCGWRCSLVVDGESVPSAVEVLVAEQVARGSRLVERTAAAVVQHAVLPARILAIRICSM